MSDQPPPTPPDDESEHFQSLPGGDPRFSHSEDDADAPDSTGKVIHLAGAGTIGMTILIVSLSILFAASIVAVLAIRAQAQQWPPPGAPHVPASLWLSTVVILFASVTVQLAHNAVRRDDSKALSRYLLATFVVGILFLILQTINWLEFYHAVVRLSKVEGPYMAMFFVLTGLHAAHVIGGLIPLGMVMYFARLGRYSRNFHPGVRYVAVYWHFLDVIWVVLFLVIYF